MSAEGSPDHKLIRAFRAQAKSCGDLGSPFTARLCSLIADRLRPGSPIVDRLFAWPGDVSSAGASLPLRLAGGWHGLVLEDRSTALRAVYPPQDIEADDAVLWNGVVATLDEFQDVISRRLDSTPQTNEVRRTAVLLPGFMTIASRTGCPLVLSELGSSAGLNLIWDRYHYTLGTFNWGPSGSPIHLTPDWRGAAPPSGELQITGRAGCDLNPLDPVSAIDRSHLLSYIWADQTDRLDLTRAALATAAIDPPEVARSVAATWLEARLSGAISPGSAHVIYHSIVWQYFDADTKQKCAALIEAAGAAATLESPIA